MLILSDMVNAMTVGRGSESKLASPIVVRSFLAQVIVLTYPRKVILAR